MTIKAILTDLLVYFGQLSAIRIFSPLSAVLGVENPLDSFDWNRVIRSFTFVLHFLGRLVNVTPLKMNIPGSIFWARWVGIEFPQLKARSLTKSSEK